MVPGRADEPGTGGAGVEDEEVLAGGMTNAGAVVRVGATVRRPWRPTTPATHRVLERLASVAPGVAPRPLGRDEQGREVLSWLDGDVATPPFAAWVVDPRFLEGLGRLLRRVHDALTRWEAPSGLEWAGELADPEGGPIVVHGDVCPENVVADAGRPVALLDWEHAAPGRPIWDLAGAAAMCVPFVSPARRHPEYGDVDVLARTRMLADAYDLDGEGRLALPRVLDQRREASEAFLRRRAAERHPAYRAWWSDPAAAEVRHRAEREWSREAAPKLAAALAQPRGPRPGG
jgi:aminoglycoside phosphotransferase (APT) family kinase protein